MDYCDLILMLVNPGFGGQTITSQLKKVEKVKNMILAKNRKIDLEVDGGVNINNAKNLVEAGANILVAGNAIFKGGHNNYRNNIKTIKNSWILSEVKKNT